MVREEEDAASVHVQQDIRWMPVVEMSLATVALLQGIAPMQIVH